MCVFPDSDSDSGTEELVQQRLAEARWRRQLAREQREREEKEREKERERKKERKKEREREREALSKPTPPTEDCTVSSPSRNEQSSHSTSGLFVSLACKYLSTHWLRSL